MRVVFLDIDGVLNCRWTTDRINGFIGIDRLRVKNLAKLMKESRREEDTKLILCSSWRIGEDRNGAEIPSGYAYLVRKLAEEGLVLDGETQRVRWNRTESGAMSRRGREINGWLYQHRGENISSYVVLDDDIFPDYERYDILPHLVQTSWQGQDGGLQEEHVKRALSILRE